MKCIKCKCENINKANYCKKCKYQFSKEEQEAAYSITFFGKIKKLEKIYSYLTLNAITGHIVFKVLSIIIILGLGIYLTLNNNTNLKIFESENYLIKYNKNQNEYYLIASEEEVPLNLYSKKQIEEINIQKIDKNDNLITETKYNIDDNIALQINSNDEYYLLKTNEETLKLYVFLEEYVEVDNEK